MSLTLVFSSKTSVYATRKDAGSGNHAVMEDGIYSALLSTREGYEVNNVS